MQRLVQPEILDSLPPEDPGAVANRRDLRLINAIMGNYRWFRRVLPPLLRPGDRILEVGAGTGELGLHLREAVGGSLTSYCGLDLWERPAEWPNQWEWVQDDLLTFDRYSDYTVLVANLILHQFNEDQLQRLGQRLAQTDIRLILANEPARAKLHQWQLKLLRPFGLHPVSRHDGHVSVAAGFRQNELAASLGFADPEWSVTCRSGFLGWHRSRLAKREIRRAPLSPMKRP